MIILRIGLTLVALSFLFSCAGPKGMTTTEKRSYVLQMHNDALEELFRSTPRARNQVRDAAGYSVFSNVNTQVIFFGAGGGYGVAVNNSSGNKTYMRMAGAQAGVGVGLKDFREIIIFNSSSAFRNFVFKGWDLSLQGGAAFKSSEKGGEASGAASVSSDVLIYTLTEAGVELQTSVMGSKYWKDDELNYTKY